MSITAEQIASVTDVEVAFGTTKLLTPYTDIPDEFKRGGNKWVRLFNAAFFTGLSDLRIAPKDGIDPDKAWKAIRAHMASWEPKHEHKEAGVAFLMSQCFEDAEWEMKS